MSSWAPSADPRKVRQSNETEQQHQRELNQLERLVWNRLQKFVEIPGKPKVLKGLDRA